MTGPTPSTIFCTKCALPRAPGASCPACGGPLVKVCGSCQQKNSLAKKFCDGCGSEMTSGAPAEGGDIPATVIKRGPGARPPIQPPAPKMPEGFQLPQAGASAPGPGGQANQPVFAPDEGLPQPSPMQYESMTRLRRRDSFQNSMILLAGAVAFAVCLVIVSKLMNPGTMASRDAEKYLEALRQGRFPAAYQMTSELSKKHCTMEEFATLRDLTPWSWRDMKVVTQEPDFVTLKYTILVQGKEPREDYISMQREDGLWVRPYNWSLLKRSEDAMEKNDPDLARLLASAAVSISPKDPMARAYLCEAEYYKRDWAKTVAECELVFSLQARYPSNLTGRTMYHLRAILADGYRGAGRLPEALAAYDQVLSLQGLDPAFRCKPLLARADVQISLNKPQDAASGLQEAVRVCADPEDQAVLQALMNRLSPAGGQ